MRRDALFDGQRETSGKTGKSVRVLLETTRFCHVTFLHFFILFYTVWWKLLEFPRVIAHGPLAAKAMSFIFLFFFFILPFFSRFYIFPTYLTVNLW
jgi:hypothetical protein